MVTFTIKKYHKMAKIEIEIPDTQSEDDIQNAIIAFAKMASYPFQPEHKRKEELQIVGWLKQLKDLFDKTYISEEFLERNGFEKREYYFLYCDDVEEISAQCVDKEMGIWRVSVVFLESGNNDSLDICTVGQLKMFLAIEGLSEIAEQLK